MARLALLKGWALAAMENMVVVYGMKEPLQTSIDSFDLGENLINFLIDQGERLHLYFEKPEKLDTNH